MVPAAVVTPAPIVYIKVGFLARTVGPRTDILMAMGIFIEDRICTSLCAAVLGTFTLRK